MLLLRMLKLLLTLVIGGAIVGSCCYWLEEYIKMPLAEFIGSFENRARKLFDICCSAYSQGNAL